MRFLYTLLLGVCLSIGMYAQTPVTYDDVAVIINDNDENSVAIGAYFAQQRNIPEGNLLHISVPAKETISGVEFDELRRQVEAALTQNDLSESINYLVTTKGVPLRVNRGGSLFSPSWMNASVDGELMLILGAHALHIGLNTWVKASKVWPHDYWKKNEHFSRKGIIPDSDPPLPYDIFLVTRLTGLTREDVLTLIDNSGPNIQVDKEEALFIFDRDPTPIELDPTDKSLAVAAGLLQEKGWNVLLNSDSVFVIEQENVLGYASWGSNDHFDHLVTENAVTRNQWLPGSIAETFVSSSARNFTPGETYGQSRIADLLEEGCAGASGYTFEPFVQALVNVDILFDRYTSGYNLAESYYMASPTRSWMTVIVGDPKTSITSEKQNITLSSETLSFGNVSTDKTASMDLSVQNPLARRALLSSITISGLDAGDFTLSAEMPASIEPNDSLLLYVNFTPHVPGSKSATLTIQEGSEGSSLEVKLHGEGIAGTTALGSESPQPASVSLHQNYPNPFNPATTIGFTLPARQHVRLTVYSAMGQRVAVIADGWYNAGVHMVPVRAGDWNSGTYFYRLESDDTSITRQMSLMK